MMLRTILLVMVAGMFSLAGCGGGSNSGSSGPNSYVPPSSPPPVTPPPEPEPPTRPALSCDQLTYEIVDAMTLDEFLHDYVYFTLDDYVNHPVITICGHIGYDRTTERVHMLLDEYESLIDNFDGSVDHARKFTALNYVLRDADYVASNTEALQLIKLRMHELMFRFIVERKYEMLPPFHTNGNDAVVQSYAFIFEEYFKLIYNVNYDLYIEEEERRITQDTYDAMLQRNNEVYIDVIRFVDYVWDTTDRAIRVPNGHQVLHLWQINRLLGAWSMLDIKVTGLDKWPDADVDSVLETVSRYHDLHTASADDPYIPRGAQLSRLTVYRVLAGFIANSSPELANRIAATYIAHSSYGAFSAAVIARDDNNEFKYDCKLLKHSNQLCAIPSERQRWIDELLPDTDRIGNIIFRHKGVDVEDLAQQLDDVYHAFMRVTGATGPVPDDPNDVVTIIIFESRALYWDMAWYLFGIPTDNGGNYFEYEATVYTFDRKPFEAISYSSGGFFFMYSLWLDELVRHEYAHYLFGRYVNPGLEGRDELIWINEGLANYVTGTRADGSIKVIDSARQEIRSDRTRSLGQAIAAVYDDPWFYGEVTAAVAYLAETSDMIYQIAQALIADDRDLFNELVASIPADDPDYLEWKSELADHIPQDCDPWRLDEIC